MNEYNPPKRRNSKRYKEIVQNGCDIEIDWHGERYCGMLYGWNCEDCPVLKEQVNKEQQEIKEGHE